MRVALVAEGSYPYATGGVSTWCDQLIRGLPDHEFEVLALTARRNGRPVMALPSNLVHLRQLPLWGWIPKRRPPGPGSLRRVLAAYRSLLGAVLAVEPQEGFHEGLRGLFDAAQEGTLTAALQTDEALRVLLAAWQRQSHCVPLTLGDALAATELLDRMMTPLSAPVLECDVVHPVSNGLPVLPALTARWARGTPYLMSEHGVYLRERYLGSQQVRYPWPVKVITLAFVRELCRVGYEQAAAIAPVNVYNQRWEIRNGADPDRILTAYNGVRPEDLPAAPGDPGRPTVGWVGRVDPLKDLETLVEAFAVVRDRVPDAVLRLFGPTPPGNERYEQQVRRRVAALGLADSVIFEGPVSPVRVAYHASSVVALSSVSEGLPYTVMEAMMCARATVSTDVGGVGEVVGDAGITVPPRDPARLGEALSEVLLSEARRTDLARRARERALSTFPLELMLSRFRGLYSEVRQAAAPVEPWVPAPRSDVEVLGLRSAGVPVPADSL